MSIDEHMKNIENYCDFSDPKAVYILILLPRKKENLLQTEREKLQKRSRYIVSNMDEVKFALEDFERYTKMYPELIFRVYISVNRRSLRKGLREYKKMIAEIDDNLIGGNEQAWTQVQKLGSEFKSVLAQKENKFDKNWMFDIDLPNNDPANTLIVEEFINDLDGFTEVMHYSKTKSGYVVVIKPCNPNLITMPPDTELKKDSYLYIGIYH